MPVRKKITKSKSLPKKASIIKSGAFPVKDLNVYHKNPRIGDVDSIAQSLDKNGQYRSIVVNIGTDATHKHEVLAGNHTFLAARKLGWETILVDFVDVDDDRARAIVLADNKTAENGTYDEKIIGELLAEVPDILSTGFKPEEAEDLISRAGAEARAALDSLSESGAFDVDFDLDTDDDGGTSMFDTRHDADDDDDFEATDDGFDPQADDPDDFVPESAARESLTTEELTDRPSELTGINDLAPDLPEDPKYWTGPLQMPKMRSDMYVKPSDLPANLQTWAGSATRDNQPDDLWWFYPWGGDSTKGLKHLDQVIVSFYSWDDSFDNWFWSPNKYAAKLLNSGIKYAVTPNWSLWDTQSNFMNLFSLYRNLYVARYLQEVGIKTIQHLGYPYNDENFLKNYHFRYVPKNQQVYAMQAMTWNSKEVTGTSEKNIKRLHQMMLDHYEPEVLLFYGVKTGIEWFQNNIAPLYPNMKVIYLPSRMDLLSEWKRAQGYGGKKFTI